MCWNMLSIIEMQLMVTDTHFIIVEMHFIIVEMFCMYCYIDNFLFRFSLFYLLLYCNDRDEESLKISFRPLHLDRSKWIFEIHDHMVISKISEFQNKEGSLPINSCGEIYSIPIGGACSLFGCTRYIYLECPIEERLLWKSLAYHECPRVCLFFIFFK